MLLGLNVYDGMWLVIGKEGHFGSSFEWDISERMEEVRLLRIRGLRRDFLLDFSPRLM